MKLYDGYSEIDWVYHGTMNAYEMENDPRFSALLSEPCVLFDDGEGRVYSFRTLKEMCEKYGVEMQGNKEETYAALLYAMNPSLPTIDSRVADCEAAICELYESISTEV